MATAFTRALRDSLTNTKSQQIGTGLYRRSCRQKVGLSQQVGSVKAGALVLFTSRKHMQETFDAVPEALRDRVLVQGAVSRPRLLEEHRRRVMNVRADLQD